MKTNYREMIRGLTSNSPVQKEILLNFDLAIQEAKKARLKNGHKEKNSGGGKKMNKKPCRHDVIYKEQGNLICDFCRKIWFLQTRYGNQETYFSSKYRSAK